MTNNRVFRFPALSVRQTQHLLAGTGSLPLSRAAARRIRASVLQKAAPKSLARNRIRRTLVPIAACLLAIVMFFVAFPKAALAVSEFLGRVFTPSRYMNEDPATRTPVPSIDEALAAAAPKDGDYRITLMPDLPNAQEFIDYRAQNGYDPFTEENWGWLRDIRPEIAEVLYDGNQLIWNTNLFTTNEHVREFMEGFGVKSGSKLSVDALLDDATYTIEGDPTIYPLVSMGGGITPVFDEATLADADHAVLYSDFAIDPATPLPDGILTITQNIRVCEKDAMDYGATVAVITHTFTFDTTKGNTSVADGAEAEVPLSGEAYLSFDHEELSEDQRTVTNWTMQTQKISLDGIVLKVLYEYLPTGIFVHMKFTNTPAEWTEETNRAMYAMTGRTTKGEYTSRGVANDLYIDGNLIGEASPPDNWANGELAYVLPVFPNQYADLQSVVMKLSLAYLVTYNGADLLSGEIYTIPEGIADSDGVVALIPLAEITVPLPKS